MASAFAPFVSTATPRSKLADGRGICLSYVPQKATCVEQLDLDLMDLLNFVIAVDQGLGVDIPESDYPRLGSLDAFVAYLSERLSVPVIDR
jgi:acyl carrier protein